MKVLIACERSQIVTSAFLKAGFDAWSCDIEGSYGDHPGRHFIMDVRRILYKRWDLVIAHPPCDHLASSGARWFKEKQADGRQQAAIAFFQLFTQLDHVRYVAIENPVGIMSTHYRKPDQYIQPWQFGHGETKKTGLWLKNLPLLIPTKIVSGREQRIWKMGPSPDRAQKRSETYQGWADAMAKQWGDYIRRKK